MTTDNRAAAREAIRDARRAADCAPNPEVVAHTAAAAAITAALFDVADAIREAKANHTIAVTQHLDAEAIARSIRTEMLALHGPDDDQETTS